MKKVILFLFLALTVNFAGNIKVIEKQKLTDLTEGEFFFPKFSPDGKSVFFTSANYSGIWQLDYTSKILRRIVEHNGAGYKFSFSEDGKKLFFRTTELKNRKRFHKLVEYNLTDNTEALLEDDARNLTPPLFVNGSEVIYAKDKNVKILRRNLSKSNALKTPVAYIENRDLVLILNGTKKVLNPLGKGIYLWPSVSPDGEKILFTLGGKGTFISDLEGNILAKFGYANYPKWSPDGNWILYMRDKDNGYNYTESDLYVSDKDGRETFKLTDTKNEIEMYGEWSPDGKEIVYHTVKGEIYLLKLEIN